MDLLTRLQVLHPNYTYNPVQIANAIQATYIDIICPVHGSFKSTIKNSLKGRGCRKCADSDRGLRKRVRAKHNFFSKAPGIHHNKYDYSKVKYSLITTPVIIICPVHGPFNQTPALHLLGSGCPKCGKVQSEKSRCKPKDDFVKRARDVHGGRYEYGSYSRISDKCTIICSIHGEFKQLPSNHLNGNGCPRCANESVSRKLAMTFEEFVKRANHKFNNRFTYKKLNKQEVYVTCSVHGKHKQKKKAHLRSSVGCPECVSYPLKYGFIEKLHQEYDYSSSTSKPHDRLLGILKNELVEVNIRSIIPPYELDIYLPEYKLAIEVNGVWFHSSKFKHDPKYHDNKFKACNALGIKLLQFWDYDIKKKENLVKSMIMANIGKSHRIYARKCIIKELSSSMYAGFLETNHIQGSVHSLTKRGLYYKDELVSVIGLTRIKGTLQLQRFCNKAGLLVVGGFSKLLKPFMGETVVSFSDNFYGNGAVYLKNGFTLARENGPRLYYTNGAMLINRRHFQKPVLKKKYPDLNMSKTEKKLAEELGYYQVFGGGTRKWIL